MVMPDALSSRDHVEHLADQLGVERRGDLVEQHDLGVHGQRPHDRDPLLLAAAELVGVGVALVGQTEPGEQLVGPLLGLGPGDPQRPAGAERHVGQHA